MKGLLRKDFYVMWKSCKLFLLMAILFAFVFLLDNNFLYLIYPSLLTGILPLNLVAQDERDRWFQYQESLPCTRRQMVSAKYCIALCCTGVLLAVYLLISGTKMFLSNQWVPEELALYIALILGVGLMNAAVTLPVVFWLGVEKGRLLSTLLLCIFCGGVAFLTTAFLAPDSPFTMPQLPLLPVIVGGILLLFAGSWVLAIALFQRREIG